MKKILFFLLLAVVGQGQAQGVRSLFRTQIPAQVVNPNLVTINVTYATAPTSPTVNFATLKYDKLGCFQFERDDNSVLSYTGDYAFFQTKSFTDGAGSPVKWRGGLALNARNNFNNQFFWDNYTGKLTTAQIAEMVQTGKWAVLNHSYYHDNDSTKSNVLYWAPRTPTYSQSAWNTVENTKYIYQKLNALGVPYVPRVLVVPSNYSGYIRAADSLSYLGTISQNNSDNYVGTPASYIYNSSSPGVNFTQYETLPLTISKYGQTQFSHYRRNFSDNWVADTPTLKLQFAGMVNTSVSDGKHRLMRIGTHTGSYPDMSTFFNYADSVAADRVWFVGATEELEYREVKRLAVKSQSLSGNTLTITLDLSAVPSVNRFRDMTLLVSGGGTITNVTATGPHDRITYNTSTGLINVFWEKTTGFPVPQL